MEVRAQACGKAILFGEHAVVYGVPAIAIPISSLTLRLTIRDEPQPQSPAPDSLQRDPLAREMIDTACSLIIGEKRNLHVTITSDVPVGGGLGSSAALSVALVRGLLDYAGAAREVERINELAYRLESIAHGSPSGIDNTVIAWERPMRYQHGTEPRFVTPGAAFHFLLVDCGERASTKQVVAGVRERWMADRAHYDGLFSRITDLCTAAEPALERGDAETLGQLMNQNHQCLKQIGVSTPLLDKLCDQALQLGAIGAKVTGAGGGGHALLLWPGAPPASAIAQLNALDPGIICRPPTILK